MVKNKKGQQIKWGEFPFNDTTETIVDDSPFDSEEKVSLSLPNGSSMEIDPRNFIIGDYIVDPKHISVIKAIANTIKNGGYLNILALGEAGSGKTTFPHAVSQLLNCGYYFLDCSKMRNPIDWFGERNIDNKRTKFELSPFSRALQSKDVSFIHLDEVNRTHVNYRGPLLNLLDDIRGASIQNNHINVSSGKIFYATANIGDDYINTTGFDKAELDRYIYVTFDTMSKERELEVLQLNGVEKSIGVDITDLMHRLRQAEMDTQTSLPFSLNIRTSLKIANLVKLGLTLKEAFVFSILNGLNEEHEEFKSAVQNLIRGNY